MPGLDKTGPMGQGSKTGRKQGNCRGNATEGQMPARGMGRGWRNIKDSETDVAPRGWGRGFGRGRQGKAQ
jgi:hypothetical protein